MIIMVVIVAIVVFFPLWFAMTGLVGIIGIHGAVAGGLGMILAFGIMWFMVRWVVKATTAGSPPKR